MKMHPMEKQFRKEIIENPKDDVVRLIFADWLEEHGGQSSFANLIRVQIELDHLGYQCLDLPRNKPCGLSDCRTCELRQLETLLMKEVVEPTITKLSRRGIVLKHRRGFVWSAKMTLTHWLEIGPLMVRLHPLETIIISNKKPLLLGSLYGWYMPEPPFHWNAADDLPSSVWSMLTDFTNQDDDCWKLYTKHEEAIDALEKATIRYAWEQPDPITTE